VTCVAGDVCIGGVVFGAMRVGPALRIHTRPWTNEKEARHVWQRPTWKKDWPSGKQIDGWEQRGLSRLEHTRCADQLALTSLAASNRPLIFEKSRPKRCRSHHITQLRAGRFLIRRSTPTTRRSSCGTSRVLCLLIRPAHPQAPNCPFLRALCSYPEHRPAFRLKPLAAGCAGLSLTPSNGVAQARCARLCRLVSFQAAAKKRRPLFSRVWQMPPRPRRASRLLF
jgi:hypothetical protein